jgi:uncharacterized protein
MALPLAAWTGEFSAAHWPTGARTRPAASEPTTSHYEIFRSPPSTCGLRSSAGQSGQDVLVVSRRSPLALLVMCPRRALAQEGGCGARPDRRPPAEQESTAAHDGAVADRNVLGADLQPCSVDPMTGFFRDGSCRTGPQDAGSHTICAVVTAEFLDHQRSIGNDLTTPRPQYRFPGLAPGDRWCVTAVNWARAYNDGVAAPVVLASTHEAVLQLVPLAVLQALAVDVPDDPSTL